MELYFTPLIICCVFFILSLVISVKNFTNILFLFLVIYCILFAGTRYESDFDYENYVEIFSLIPSFDKGWSLLYAAMNSLYLEPTFAIFVSVFKLFIPDLGVFVIIASFSLIIYYRVLIGNVKYPLLAYFIYLGDGFYLREFTQIRFGLAVALGLLSMTALKNKRFGLQYFYIISACIFHFTAVMLCFTNFWIKFVKGKKIVFIASSILCILAFVGFFDGLIDYIVSIGLAPQRILDHVGTDDAENISRVALIASYGILIWMLKIIPEDDKDYFWVQIYSLSFFFLCLFSGFDLMRRIAFYFSIAIYIITSTAFVRRKYGFVLLAITYSIFLFISRMNILYPYKSWLFF